MAIKRVRKIIKVKYYKRKASVKGHTRTVTKKIDTAPTVKRTYKKRRKKK